jgi:hypothetical protein
LSLDRCARDSAIGSTEDVFIDGDSSKEESVMNNDPKIVEPPEPVVAPDEKTGALDTIDLGDAVQQTKHSAVSDSAFHLWRP